MNLYFDTETDTLPYGNPQNPNAKAYYVGCYKDDEYLYQYAQEGLSNFGTNFGIYDLVVGFNIKFDLKWAQKLGSELPNKVWCVALAHYMLRGQKHTWPSLDEVAAYYGFPLKLDIVKTEYWDKGINTDKVPFEILHEYCKQDVWLTKQCYLKQVEEFKEKPALFKLFKLCCMDLLLLIEAENNGLLYKEEVCAERSLEAKQRLLELTQTLKAAYPQVPINFGSGDQLSAFLYGGNIIEETKVLDGVYKSGIKKGQPKYKNVDVIHTLPRQVEPLARSELKKPGFFATDEATLKKLKGPFAKKYVTTLLEMAKLDKLIGTYYEGLPKQAKEQHWPKGYIFGEFNQTATQTGRLSSHKPNRQNFSGEILDMIVSRYD